MPRSKSRKGKGRSRDSSQSRWDKLTKEMTDLLNFQKQQIRFSTPNTVDVPFPIVKVKMYTVPVSYDLGVIAASATTSTMGAFYFSLAGLPNYGLFTAIYDRYRMLNVRVSFQPTGVVTTGGGLITALDYDDASAPTIELEQRDTAQNTPIGTFFERTLVPRIAVAAYSGAFTSYGNVGPGMWFDTASPNVQYYGLKYYLATQSAVGNVYQLKATCLMQFKNNF